MEPIFKPATVNNSGNNGFKAPARLIKAFAKVNAKVVNTLKLVLSPISRINAKKDSLVLVNCTANACCAIEASLDNDVCPF